MLLLAPRALGRHPPRFAGVLAVLAIFLLVRFVKPDQRLDDITPGLLAYLFTLVFMAPRLSAPGPLVPPETPASTA